MRAFKNALLASVFVLGSVSAASAAEIIPYEDTSAPEPVYTNSAHGLYVRGDFGWSWVQNGGSGDNSVLLGAGVGYRFSDMFRADVRFDYAFDYKNKAADVEYDIGSVLVNGYIDIPLGAFGLTPYVGVGAGYGWTDVEGDGTNGSFVGALMGGVSYDLSDRLALDVGYRFRHAFSDHFANVGGEDRRNDHSVIAGVRFSF